VSNKNIIEWQAKTNIFLYEDTITLLLCMDVDIYIQTQRNSRFSFLYDHIIALLFVLMFIFISGHKETVTSLFLTR